VDRCPRCVPLGAGSLALDFGQSSLLKSVFGGFDVCQVVGNNAEVRPHCAPLRRVSFDTSEAVLVGDPVTE